MSVPLCVSGDPAPKVRATLIDNLSGINTRARTITTIAINLARDAGRRFGRTGLPFLSGFMDFSELALAAG